MAILGNQRFNFQYPRSGALWTFCSLNSRFRAVITTSGRFRNSCAKSRSLTITSPVGYRWCTVCPYDEILSASDRNSFFLFRSARLARTSSVSKDRMQMVATPRRVTINMIHQRSGTDETISGKECMTGISVLEIR
jgi:hypothetical protein